MLLDEKGNPLHVQNFDHLGRILYQDFKNGLVVRAGNIFEARTVKGHTNLIVAMRVLNGHMYYLHGDKARKVRVEEFARAIEYGDLIPRAATEIDTERLSMCAIGLDAIANRRTAEETIDFYGEGAAERFMSS
jgi:hypothetical protein